MSLVGAEPTSDAASSAAWIEVQFAVDPAPQLASGSRQAMEKLLIDAQRESGQSSLAQSGSASPAIAGSGSRSPTILLAAGPQTSGGGGASASLQSSGVAGDWPTKFVASQAPGLRKFQMWRFLSLRKTRLVRKCDCGSLLVSLLSHAASFLLGATSMYIICRWFSPGQEGFLIR